MKYFSTFSGIGGFELGIQNAYEIHNKPKDERHETKTNSSLSNSNDVQTTATCIGYSEVDKYAIETYEKNFKGHKNYGDITKINEKTLPDFDLLVGGFPCQAFSIAGKRRGFEDTRGTLFFDLARIIREKQPRNFIFENVKGLLSHNKGDTFTTIITTLDELGYDCEWQVLNSKNFGVPQNRERVYIVGHLRGESRPKVFPITETARESSGEKVGLNPRNFNGKHYVSSNKSVALSLPSGNNATLVDVGRIRRLTPIECERLQGFPDNWTENGLSDIMEVCVNTNNVTEKVSPILDTASCIIRDGNVMVQQINNLGQKNLVNIAPTNQTQEVCALSTTNLGEDMVMLFNQNEISRDVEKIKKNHICEKTEERCICKLWKVQLDVDLKKEKSSTTLTLIRETMKYLTSIYMNHEENIIGVIIHLNSQGQNSIKENSLYLRAGNITSTSDTQRYKQCGNAVTTNVVEEIIRRLCK